MKIFKVDGYWKNDGTEFADYLISEYDDLPEGYYEEEMFYFGLSEKDLLQSSPEDDLEFVITSYVIYN